MVTSRTVPRVRRTRALAREIADIDAALALVTARVATTVRLAALRHGERLGARTAARAAALGVAFRIERHGRGDATLVVGPLLVRPDGEDVRS